MRILTCLASPGMRLASAIESSDGLPICGRGTLLSRRLLDALAEDGFTSLDVEPEDVALWQARLSSREAFMAGLDARLGDAGGGLIEWLRAAVAEVVGAHLEQSGPESR